MLRVYSIKGMEWTFAIRWIITRKSCITHPLLEVSTVGSVQEFQVWVFQVSQWGGQKYFIFSFTSCWLSSTMHRYLSISLLDAWCIIIVKIFKNTYKPVSFNGHKKERNLLCSIPNTYSLFYFIQSAELTLVRLPSSEYKLDNSTVQLIEGVHSSAQCHHICMASLGTSCRSFAYNSGAEECMISASPAIVDADNISKEYILYSLGKSITAHKL